MTITANRTSQRTANDGSGHGAGMQNGCAGGSPPGLVGSGWAGPDVIAVEKHPILAQRAGGRDVQSPTAASPIIVSIVTRDVGFFERMSIELAHLGDICLLGPRWDPVRSRVADLMQVAQGHVVVVDADVAAQMIDGPEFQSRHRSALSNLILVANDESPAVVDVVLATRSRGCITTKSDADSFARAVRAVALGDLWLPRWILAALYERTTGTSFIKPRSRQDDSGGAHLSPRETEVLALARTGLTNKEIALQLHVSPSTVKKQLGAALVKCGMFRRRQLLP